MPRLPAPRPPPAPRQLLIAPRPKNIRILFPTLHRFRNLGGARQLQVGPILQGNNSESPISNNGGEMRTGIPIRRFRSTNWTPEEKTFVLDLIQQKVDDLNDRSTNSVSNMKKRKAWQWIAEEYGKKANFSSRSPECIQSFWRKLKADTKNAIKKYEECVASNVDPPEVEEIHWFVNNILGSDKVTQVDIDENEVSCVLKNSSSDESDEAETETDTEERQQGDDETEEAANIIKLEHSYDPLGCETDGKTAAPQEAELNTLKRKLSTEANLAIKKRKKELKNKREEYEARMNLTKVKHQIELEILELSKKKIAMQLEYKKKRQEMEEENLRIRLEMEEENIRKKQELVKELFKFKKELYDDLYSRDSCLNNVDS